MKNYAATLKGRALEYALMALCISYVMFWFWLLYKGVVLVNQANPYLLAHWGVGLFLVWVAAFIGTTYLILEAVGWLGSMWRRIWAPRT